MKRIFGKNIHKLELVENIYENVTGDMIKVNYKKVEQNSGLVLDGIFFNRNNELTLKLINIATGDTIYNKDESKKNSEAARLIFKKLNGKNNIIINFNPYNKSNNGIMIFFDNTEKNEKITGLGLDINNEYIVQKVNLSAAKYENKFYYSDLNIIKK